MFAPAGSRLSLRPGSWSTYLAPRKSAEETMARASLWGRTAGSRGSVTVTCATRSSRTFPTRPFFTPDTRTGSPSFRPLTFLNTTSTGIAFETIERPVSQNMKPVNTTKPTSTRAPTVTSRLYVTSTRLPTFLRFGLDQRHLEIALQELQHRRILGREDLVRRSDGADLRLPQERHPVRHPERAPHVVRHHHARHPQLVPQPLDQPVDHVGVDGIEPRGRLVVQEILGLPRDRPRDSHALLHPARQLGRQLGRHLGREVHEPQAFEHAVLAELLVVIARLVGNAEPDVLGHAHRVEQRAVLEHVADLAAQRGQLLTPELGHVQPVHDHVARVGAQQAVDHLESHALPHPGGAEQRHRLAVLHLERHAVEHHVFDEPLVDVQQLDHFATSSSFVMTASSIRIATDAATTAVVVARPTPSAPCCVLKPR